MRETGLLDNSDYEEMKLKLVTTPELADGVYSNLMVVSHRRGEFVIDFLYIQPDHTKQIEGPRKDRTSSTTTVSLRARPIVPPDQIKRFANALIENIRRYEETYGQIYAAEAQQVH